MFAQATPPNQVVITYTYDPLYRLTGATYSGAYTYTFAYTYDKVGNRTVQTRTITSTLVTTYTYDVANRLINAGGVAHTWDNNGNLLNDGSATYGYDFENRLISTTLGGATTQFAYNGDGIRLRLVEAGTLTTYTQDYAAPLPVVLQAKTSTGSTQYVYSLGTRPLAEYEAAAWEYLLADALGSVRQIADASGNVMLLKSYEPYGSVLNSQGSATSVFAYAGEQIDSTGLIYLRARYMQPRLGVFLSRDPLSGNVMQPGSMNGWNYVEGNPINQIDPSGQSVAVPCVWPNHIETVYQFIPETGQLLIVEERCVGPFAIGVGNVRVGAGPMPGTDPGSTMDMSAPGPAIAKLIIVGGLYACYTLAEKLVEELTKPATRQLTIEEFYNLPTPEPEQKPKPKPTPTLPVPFPKPTETPQPKRKHIAMGIAEYMFGFWRGLNRNLNPQNIYVYTFDDWDEVGLSDVPASMALGTFGLAFDQATSRAERIHFNLEGIQGNPNQFAEEWGGQGLFGARHTRTTAVELYWIKKRTELCAKTDFYERGSVDQTPSTTWWAAICN